MVDILRKCKELLLYLLSIFIEMLFLVGWAFLVTAASKLVNKYLIDIHGINLVVFQIFETVFAISTIIPIIISLCRDFIILIRRAQKEIEKYV